LLTGSTVSSVYIGGGTPTAVPTSSLVQILTALSRFPKEDGFRLCVETSPLTTVSADGRDKLSTLVAAGVNRFSIGIQTFEDRLLRRTRGHGQGEALEAVDTLAKLGVEFNVDLMQDLPHQSEQSLIDDLSWIDRLKPHQVTWYLLRVHPDSPWFHLHERGDLELPAQFESARRRLLIREGMRRIGYTARPGGRFVRDASIHDQFKEVRAGTEATLLGMGVSAYSHGWGYFFRNGFSMPKNLGIRRYVEQILSRGLAVESGLCLDPAEVAAGKMVAGIRGGVRLAELEPAPESYISDAAATLRVLSEAGLINVDEAGTWSLTELGWVFEEEICSLFYSEPVKRRLAERKSYWATIRGGAIPADSREPRPNQEHRAVRLKKEA
jgi:oxygen-independent coproporphyrinogen-3 oxidase